MTPHDVRDYDFQNPPLVVDGARRRLRQGRPRRRVARTARRAWTATVGVHRNDSGPLPRRAVSVCPGLLGGVETPAAAAGRPCLRARRRSLLPRELRRCRRGELHRRSIPRAGRGAPRRPRSADGPAPVETPPAVARLRLRDGRPRRRLHLDARRHAVRVRARRPARCCGAPGHRRGSTPARPSPTAACSSPRAFRPVRGPGRSSSHTRYAVEARLASRCIRRTPRARHRRRPMPVCSRPFPADGQVLPTAPTAAVLHFDNGVVVGPGNAAVDSGGHSVLDGVARARGHVLTIPLDRLERGSYTIRWSVVSDDGHNESGIVAFAVGAARPHATLHGARQRPAGRRRRRPLADARRDPGRGRREPLRGRGPTHPPCRAPRHRRVRDGRRAAQRSNGRACRPARVSGTRCSRSWSQA